MSRKEMHTIATLAVSSVSIFLARHVIIFDQAAVEAVFFK